MVRIKMENKSSRITRPKLPSSPSTASDRDEEGGKQQGSSVRQADGKQIYDKVMETQRKNDR